MVRTLSSFTLLNWLIAGFRHRHNQGELKLEERLVSFETVLQSAIERMRTRLFVHAFIPRKFHPRNVKFEPNVTDSSRYIQSITIEETRNIELQPGCHANSDETYSLEILDDGHIKVRIKSSRGALYALETISQLFYAHSASDGAVYTPYAPVNIIDCPAFEHRGLNLDISRNWLPPEDVMRTIEAMGSNKLNRLHIHASDAQSWPLEIPTLPQLALEGAYDPSQIWTAADLRDVQKHGLNHGVEVYLEIDLPGHTASIAHACRNLTVAAHELHWSSYAVEPPSGQLKLNSSEVPSFLATLLNDLLPRSSKYSSLFHIGGDELNLEAYTLEPTVNSSSTAVIRPLLQSFIDHMLSITTSHSLTPLVWEEMLLEWNLTLPASTIIQTWKSATSLSAVLQRGHKALFGANTHWYLDCGHGYFLDPNPSNPDSPIKPPYTDYCGPYKNWRHVYSYDPLADVMQAQRQLVVGGEVHLWGELTDSVTLDGMLWPRAAAAAEVLWSGTGRPMEEETTRRLAEMRERLVLAGVAAGMVQMEWCLRHEGGCTL